MTNQRLMIPTDRVVSVSNCCFTNRDLTVKTLLSPAESGERPEVREQEEAPPVSQEKKRGGNRD